MSNKTEAARAVCPFWRASGGKKLKCEGIFGRQVETTFDTAEERALYEARFCDAICRYRDCPVAAAILRRYKE
jgi:hypothetical protein